jgi:hypothetical protein
MKNKKVYKYILHLSKPVKPRTLADDLINTGYEKELIAVEDAQFDQHMYGSTYQVKGKQSYREPFKSTIANLKSK